MPSKLFHKVLSEHKPESKIFVQKYVDIVERIYQILKAKSITQKELAERMGKKESEISRWLSGEHNMTIKSIAKLEAALGVPIISIVLNGNQSDVYKNSQESTRGSFLLEEPEMSYGGNRKPFKSAADQLMEKGDEKRAIFVIQNPAKKGLPITETAQITGKSEDFVQKVLDGQITP